MHRHTFLVNQILALCARDMRGQPLFLLDYGYRAHAIEKRIHVKDRIVVPDVIFINKETGHMLVVDCKSGANVRADQDIRYSQMRLEDLIKATRPPCKVDKHTFVYAIEEPYLRRIRPHTDAALIIFGRSYVRSYGDLGNYDLTQLLQKGVSLKDALYPKLNVYPFSIHDERQYIDKNVRAGLLLYLRGSALEDKSLANNAVALEILRILHPHHAIFSPSHRDELVSMIRESVARICAMEGA